jgi:hypothetical protein
MSDNWIVTASGRQFDYEHPELGLDIRDIATSLASTCRFGGHVTRYYSVARHSIHVSLLVPTRYAMYGLLHDAAEAYVGDVVRPLKNLLPSLRPIEKRIERAIFERFTGAPMPEEAQRPVKLADLIALATERRDVVCDKTGLPWFFDGTGIEPSPTPVAPSDPGRDMLDFLARFEQLGGAVAAEQHELKCWPAPFQAMRNETKPYEIRRSDRCFRVGDSLFLREWMPQTGQYTGRSLTREVTYISGPSEWGLPANLVVMGVRAVPVDG